MPIKYPRLIGTEFKVAKVLKGRAYFPDERGYIGAVELRALVFGYGDVMYLGVRAGKQELFNWLYQDEPRVRRLVADRVHASAAKNLKKMFASRVPIKRLIALREASCSEGKRCRKKT